EITGNDAIDYLGDLLSRLHPNDAVVLGMIIQKDVDCGVSVKTCNKIFGKGFIDEMGYMRCSGANEKTILNIDYPTWSQIKADGAYMNVFGTSDDVDYFSRNGKQYDYINQDLNAEYIKLVEEIGWGDVVFNGEVVLVDGDETLDRKTGNGIVSKFGKGTGSLRESKMIRFLLWDVIPLDDFLNGQCDIPYETRFNTLHDAIDKIYGSCSTLEEGEQEPYLDCIETKVVDNWEEAIEHYKEAQRRGLEGTVLKDPKKLMWKHHTSKHQLKIKVEFDCTLEVIGINPGNGRNAATFGSLECKSCDGEVVVNVSGFKDKERKEIHAMGKSVIGKLMDVTSNEVIENKANVVKSLFHPRFSGFRDDRSEADDLEHIIEAYEIAAFIKEKTE
ncbi:MAG: ATP-dependent DNA ligase, partial [Candidatus Thorarchaeota archaeon]